MPMSGLRRIIAAGQCVELWTSEAACSPAISANRHSALISGICSIVRARGSSRHGLATMDAKRAARSVCISADTLTRRRPAA